MASECVGRPTSCCYYASGSLASCTLIRRSSGSESGPGTRERLQAIQLTSASLCLLRESALCKAAFGCQRGSACSCASTSCRSSTHCVSWLSESSTSVLSTFVSSEHSLSPRSVTRCMSSRHRGQLSVAVEAVANSSRSDLVFTKALLSFVPWSSRDCSGISTGSHIFHSAWRLSSQRRVDCIAVPEPRLAARFSSSPLVRALLLDI